MSGVVDRAAGHAVFGGFFNQHFHHVVAGHHAHSVVGVHDHRGGGVFHNVHFSLRQQGPVDNPVNVDGLEPVASVAFDAPPIGFQQDVGADFRVVLRYAVALEGVDEEAVHQVPGYVRSRFHVFHTPFANFEGHFAYAKRAQ